MKCAVPLAWKDIQQCLHHKITIDNTFLQQQHQAFWSSIKNNIRNNFPTKLIQCRPTVEISDANTGFPAKSHLRNERINSILMKRHDQILVVLLIGWSKFPRWHENVGSYLWASATMKRFRINLGFSENAHLPLP